jgi:lysophospholipase L1-like esterase
MRAVFLAIAFAAALALPTVGHAQRGPAVGYLALGDSVAAGAEVGEPSSYPRRLAERMANETGRAIRYQNNARDREMSHGVLTNQLVGLGELAPRIVTLTVGANDFIIPAMECVSSTLDSDPATACRPPNPLSALAHLQWNLRQLLAKVTSETPATVVVTTYYNPYRRGSHCLSGLVEYGLRQLNGAIGRVAVEFGDRVVLVDMGEVLNGRDPNDPAGWFAPNAARAACTNIHPGPAGHVAISDAIWRALAGRAPAV